jgi:hypothetical protein
MRRNIAPLAALALAATHTAVSAQTMNVQSLMDDGYTVTGITQLPGGGRAYSCRKATRLSFAMSLRRRLHRRSQPDIASR